MGPEPLVKSLTVQSIDSLCSTPSTSRPISPLDLSDPRMIQTKRGLLKVKIIEARNLYITGDVEQAQVYCTVQFEGSEGHSLPAVSPGKGSITSPDKKASPIASKVNSARTSPTNGGKLDSAKSKAISSRDLFSEGAGTNSCPAWNYETTFDVTCPDGELIVTIWDRRPLATNPKDEELFLGMIRLRPPRVQGKAIENWFRLIPRQWKEKVKGEIRIEMTFTGAVQEGMEPNHFDLLKVVGRGSFGKVLQVRKKDTQKIYAMKILTKKDIIKRKEVEHTMAERNVLMQLQCPFLVGLKFSFQTKDKLYLVLDYMNGGELFFRLQQEQSFSEERAKFYLAEILIALQHLHKIGIIYRDLKPENILLDSTGHVALTDFGLCKEHIGYDTKTHTFCGTAEYLAPEILKSEGYGRPVDWWSLGILFYEMMSGVPPFYDGNHTAMYRKILYSPIPTPRNASPLAQDLLNKLLERNPVKRLGSGPEDGDEIRRHGLWARLDWENVYKRQIKPPFKPLVTSDADSSNFDKVFTDEVVKDTPIAATPLSEAMQKEFEGFSFAADSNLRGLHSAR